jgi:hypothetical protein
MPIYISFAYLDSKSRSRLFADIGSNPGLLAREGNTYNKKFNYLFFQFLFWGGIFFYQPIPIGFLFSCPVFLLPGGAAASSPIFQEHNIHGGGLPASSQLYFNRGKNRVLRPKSLFPTAKHTKSSILTAASQYRF